MVIFRGARAALWRALDSCSSVGFLTLVEISAGEEATFRQVVNGFGLSLLERSFVNESVAT